DSSSYSKALLERRILLARDGSGAHVADVVRQLALLWRQILLAPFPERFQRLDPHAMGNSRGHMGVDDVPRRVVVAEHHLDPFTILVPIARPGLAAGAVVEPEPKHVVSKDGAGEQRLGERRADLVPGASPRRGRPFDTRCPADDPRICPHARGGL